MDYKLGMDVGSTTIKVVLLNQQDEILYKSYERHFSKVRQMALEKILQLKDLIGNHKVNICITGSAGLGVAKQSGLPFVQEVFATAGCVKHLLPKTDVVIELGGEDAKIIFLKGALEERMNSTCAGGTGAFIDQMASLLGVDLQTLDQMSLNYEKIYPIASRCGVFAKSDIQPLINQGAKKENIAASIFQAVVDQTIAGLAQGRPIEGNVLFLGGPLSFLKGLQHRFVQTLNLSQQQANFHPLAPYFVCLGSAYAAMENGDSYSFEELVQRFESASKAKSEIKGLPPLFKNQQEYDEFAIRHSQATVNYSDLKTYHGRAYLGVDAGSTTTKMVLLDENLHILYNKYVGNQGNPVDAVKEQLTEIYGIAPQDLTIAASAVTGYGEELIKAAFDFDFGLVETVAHFTAAKYFRPNVDFIIDIGGQDMKCFRIKDNSIDDIVLNEACSSGCGSFIETFAKSMGYTIDQFAKIGQFAKRPVDLGSRCTVFMNSSVKQAQKNGALVEDISAGLAVSVVKNALYKVIRAKSAQDIGKNIVVQGGTFLNDLVLRSFEQELNANVTRPAIAGLMGAFGAAIFAMKNAVQSSTTKGRDAVKCLEHQSKTATCNLCTNHCSLTVNTFEGGKKQISGNRCQRPISGKMATDQLDMVSYKFDQLFTLQSKPGKRGKIGLPLALNMFENLPFWHQFFTQLDFEVVLSGRSSKALYAMGQNTISSDTVCYPAKLVHGHIKALVDQGVPVIFYPCMTYNFDEKHTDNCYNCPVVAYYPEVIYGNMPLENTKFLYPYISLNDPVQFSQRIHQYLVQSGIDVTLSQVQEATAKGFECYAQYKAQTKKQAQLMMQQAAKLHKKSIVLAGRPYHIDPQINHGINKLLSGLGFAVFTEDCVCDMVEPAKVQVLNQWTYHARMYNAAKYVSTTQGCELIQLVSFGCGLDAITTDEVRAILRDKDKLYTQIKIDEIDNLGAVKIRVRSLQAAMNERERSMKKK